MQICNAALRLSALALFAAPATFSHAEEKDIFDHAKQKAAGKDVKKIVFIADHGTHGSRGNHEFLGGSVLLARQLNTAYPNVHAVVHSKKHWPKDLAHADAVVVLLNHGGPAAKDPRIAAAVKRGAGFAAIHYGVEVNKGEEGKNYLEWMGGYFETFWSVNPHWTAKFSEFPEHPITRGVKPFSINDEWYFHMRFREGMKGVTPILSDLPPLEKVRSKEKPTPRGGNPQVWEAVKAGKKQHVAWAYERPDGGRGFGFTGLHKHRNLGNDGFRTVLLNGIAWVTKLDVPKGGVLSKTPSDEDLEEVIDVGRGAVKQGK